MTLLSVAAQNASLDFSYGASKAASAPGSHTLHLFVGDPAAGGTELASGGGWSPPTLPNNGSTWLAASGGLKSSAPIALPTSTGAWSGEATHWLLRSGGTDWDSGALGEEIDIQQAGVTKTVTLTVYYGSGI